MLAFFISVLFRLFLYTSLINDIRMSRQTASKLTIKQVEAVGHYIYSTIRTASGLDLINDRKDIGMTAAVTKRHVDNIRLWSGTEDEES